VTLADVTIYIQLSAKRSELSKDILIINSFTRSASLFSDGGDLSLSYCQLICFWEIAGMDLSLRKGSSDLMNMAAELFLIQTQFQATSPFSFAYMSLFLLTNASLSKLHLANTKSYMQTEVWCWLESVLYED